MKKTATLLLITTLVALSLVGCDILQPQPKVYKIGILQLTERLAEVEGGFKAGMVDLDYAEGKNVTYVRKNASGNMDDLQRFAQELVDEKVDLILSVTTPASVMAMKASEGTDIPIVFILVSDPVRARLVESPTQPGGRVTGIIDGATETTGKRLELLQRMAPSMQKVLFVYSDEEALLPAADNLRQAATKLGLTLVEKQVHTTEEATAAFQAIQPGEVDAIFLPADAVVADAKDAISALSIRDGLPHIYAGRQSDALAAYGVNFNLAGSQAASLTDKILRGADPATLPVELPKKFDLVIDLSVAKQIGLTVPADVLNIADAVLE